MLQQLVDAVVLASIYVLFSLGMSLAWGILGILNLAHGAILMFSALVSYLWADSHQMPLGVALAHRVHGGRAPLPASGARARSAISGGRTATRKSVSCGS